MLRPRPRLAPVMSAIRPVMRPVCARPASGGAPDAAELLPDPVSGRKRRLPCAAARFSMNAVATALDELRDIVRRHCAGEGATIPRVEIRTGTGKTAPLPAVYPTMVCFVLQGCKRVTFGSRTLAYRGESYMLLTADLPVTAQVIEATARAPYLAVSLLLDPAAIAGLLIDIPPAQIRTTTPGSASARSHPTCRRRCCGCCDCSTRRRTSACSPRSPNGSSSIACSRDRTGRCSASSPSPAAACRRSGAPSSGSGPMSPARCASRCSPFTPA